MTGHLPFKADTPIAMIQSQVSDAPTPPRELRAELPEWLDATLARALAKAPVDCFQSANEFRLALETGLGVATSTRFERARMDSTRWSKLRPSSPFGHAHAGPNA